MTKLSGILLLLGALLLLSAALLTAAPTELTIPWYVVGNGGGTSANETYSVSGTMGQNITAVSTSETYSLSSGYWSGSASKNFVYLPTIIK